MAKYFDVHPDNPQPRAVRQIADSVREGALIAYPTDSCYALGCGLGSREGVQRIRSIRHLDDRHHFTLVCQDFAQLGQFVRVDNDVFRAIKASTPGSYTFILPATREVPRMLQHPQEEDGGGAHPGPRRHPGPALGARRAAAVEHAAAARRGGADDAGWEIKDRLDHVVDAVVDSGDCGTEPTTVIDFSGGEAEIVRRGAGDTSRFE